MLPTVPPPPAMQDHISFPPDRLSQLHCQHLQCAINTNAESIPFALKKTLAPQHRPALPGGAAGCGQSSGRVALLPCSSLLHTARSLLAHNGSIISRASYKTGFVRTKNNKAVLSLFFFFSTLQVPGSPSLPVQNSVTSPKGT